MGIYRNRFAIIADILEAVSKNAKKTQIMYKANLSYKVLQKYLMEITNATLIYYSPEENCYKLTVRGQEFIQVYKQYCRYSKNVEKRLTYLNNSKKTLQEFCQSS